MSESSSTARRRWTEEEDNKLRRLVAAATEDDETLIVWRDVATELNTRNANQCRERWTNHLRPGIRRGDWSKEEDATIEKLQKQIGNHWSQIAAELDKRTDIDVKNRWHKLQRSKRRSETTTAPTPRVGMKVLVNFEEEGYNKLYDGTITAVDNDEEQPGAFNLQIQYEDGSFEDDCNYPDDDIYLVDCQTNSDGLTEEEVSLSSELLNIHYSLLADGGNAAKKQRITSKDEACDEENISVKENRHANLKGHH